VAFVASHRTAKNSPAEASSATACRSHSSCPVPLVAAAGGLELPGASIGIWIVVRKLRIDRVRADRGIQDRSEDFEEFFCHGRSSSHLRSATCVAKSCTPRDRVEHSRKSRVISSAVSAGGSPSPLVRKPCHAQRPLHGVQPIRLPALARTSASPCLSFGSRSRSCSVSNMYFTVLLPVSPDSAVTRSRSTL